MKIALLISGEFREFEIAHKSWTFLKWPHLDVYWSIWSNSQIRHQNHSIVNEPIDINLILSTNPKKILIESSAETKISGPLNMIHRIKDGLKMILDSEIKYDVILIIRPDLMISETDMYIHSQLWYVYQNQICMVNMYNKPTGESGDQLLILTVDYAKKFIDYTFEKYYDDGLKFETIDTHKELVNFFGDSATAMPDFANKHLVVRANARNLSKEDQTNFYKVLQKTAEWWEEKYKTPYCLPDKI